MGANDLSFPLLWASGANAGCAASCTVGQKIKIRANLYYRFWIQILKIIAAILPGPVFLKSAPKKLADAYNPV